MNIHDEIWAVSPEEPLIGVVNGRRVDMFASASKETGDWSEEHKAFRVRLAMNAPYLMIALQQLTDCFSDADDADNVGMKQEYVIATDLLDSLNFKQSGLVVVPPSIPRFRVRDNEGNLETFKAHTTQECYDYLTSVQAPNKNFTVEDLKDDITVDGDVFAEAFAEGECPGDLQFF